VGNLHDARDAVVVEAERQDQDGRRVRAHTRPVCDGDGNLLLDVGPMPDGRIEPRQVEVLNQIGAWLARYGESIYGTRGVLTRAGPGEVDKERERALPPRREMGGDRLELPPLEQKIVRTTVLTGGPRTSH